MRPETLSLAILTIEPQSYSTRRLVEAARARGADVRLIDTMACVLEVEDGQLAVRCHGEVMPTFDAVIPRIGVRMTGHGCAVVRHFEGMGTTCLSSADAIWTSRDKRSAHQALSVAGLPLPPTVMVCVPPCAEDIVSSLPLPLVLKPVLASQGEGAVLVRTMGELQVALDQFGDQKTDCLVQSFIEEADGADLRCLVIGDQVVAAMKRQAATGEFRANLHLGGTAVIAELSEEERDLAVRAAQTFGLPVAGVDLLRSNTGPLVLEVNSSPGLEGIEACTGLDLAALIIAETERRIASGADALGYPGAAA